MRLNLVSCDFNVFKTKISQSPNSTKEIKSWNFIIYLIKFINNNKLNSTYNLNSSYSISAMQLICQLSIYLSSIRSYLPTKVPQQHFLLYPHNSLFLIYHNYFVVPQTESPFSKHQNTSKAHKAQQQHPRPQKE